jgi:hypothetical protein
MDENTDRLIGHLELTDDPSRQLVTQTLELIKTAQEKATTRNEIKGKRVMGQTEKEQKINLINLL